jgi:DNA-binding SARP family transcriptional activator/tetratricopeptide (TPR) repeat protein
VSADVEFCVLGPLLVRCGGAPLPALPGRQRAILAALLLSAGRMVSLAELCEITWGAEPPATAHATMRNYVKELRKALAACGESRIATVPGGYQFRVTDAELDVTMFEALAASARGSAAGGDWQQASALLRTALALWRGDPLADVPSEWLAAREAPRLAELRLQAVEARIEADLQLARHEDVISGLWQLTTVHPFRERLHGQLMLALHWSGRQAEALRVYQALRTSLRSELGVEPGPELRLLHRQMLGAPAPGTTTAPPSPGREAAAGQQPLPAWPTAGRPGGTAVPRQLPALTRCFTGRAAELSALTGMLGEASGASGATLLCAITGTAGAGKTATAVCWAHHVADRFPDGQLFADLHGYDPGEPLPAADALAGFLRALGFPGRDMPDGEAERAALYRSLLSGRRVLVVLDNACSAEQVRPLLPGTPGSAAVVTSRDALAGLMARDGAARIELPVLGQVEAVALLRALIGERADDDEAAGALAAVCSRLPLALRVAAELAAARPAEPLAGLVTELSDQRRRLDLLDTGGDARTAVRTVLSWSCRHLDTAATRAFRLLGLHPGSDFDAHVVAALTGSGIPEARQLLGTLARAYLVQPAGAGRHAMHDLLRAYAAEQAAAPGADPERTAAITRLLDYYLHTSHAAAMLLNPTREPRSPGAPQPGVTLAPLETREAAIGWFEAEHVALQGAIDLADASDLGAHCWQLARMLAAFLALRGYQAESITAMRTALAAAQRAGDVPGQAHTLRELGGALLLLDRGSEAGACLRRALALHRGLGDQAGQGRACHYLSIACERAGRYPEALRYARRALRLFRAAGNLPGQARAMNNVGWYRAHLGQHQQAVLTCQQAVALHREVSDRRGEAAAWDSLGYAHRCLGGYAEAVACYQAAVSLYAEAGDRYQSASARAHLGDAHEAAGDPAAAGEAWRQALDALEELGHPDADAIRSRLEAACEASRLADARAG